MGRPPPTRQLLQSGGLVHVEGPLTPGPHPPVLLLHGVGGGAWSWAPQREALGGEFSCFTWEGRGHGEAPRVADAGLSDYYQDAREALEHVCASTGQPAVVVGHSMGGLMALSLACERPAQVRGVFLVEPVYAEHGALPVTPPRVVLALLRALMVLTARSYLRDGWFGRALSWPLFRWAFHDPAARARAWVHQRAQVPIEYPRMLLESVDGVRGFPFQPFAEVVQQPVFLLEALPRAGARSRFSALAARLARRLGADAHVDGVVGGHYLQLDRPAEVTARLSVFARALGRG